MPALQGGRASSQVGQPWDLKRGRIIDGKNEFDVLVEPSASEGIREAAVSAVVFCAPDCRTFSRAREIPVPGVRCGQRHAEEFPLGFTKGL